MNLDDLCLRNVILAVTLISGILIAAAIALAIIEYPFLGQKCAGGFEVRVDNMTVQNVTMQTVYIKTNGEVYCHVIDGIILAEVTK